MLKRGGHDVVAITLLFSDAEHDRAKCELAREVCSKLGLEQHVVDARDLYRSEVLDRFVQAYEQGLTPDPFVLQTERVLLPQLRAAAEEHGCDKIATGHYASITNEPDAPGILPLQLAIPLDKTHDETYYLRTLTQDDLATFVFPLWDTSKPVTHVHAMRAGLMVPEFASEQRVGFLEGFDRFDWLETQGGLKAAVGDVVHVTTQAVLGEHRGLHRHDLGSKVECTTASGEDLHVVAKDVVGNRLLVGPKALVGSEQCMVRDVSWISIEAPEQKRSCKARFAQGRKPVPVQLMPTKQGLLCTFNERVQGVMPGEPIVFYSDKLVLGGGVVVG